jgi:hypothetical protein
MRFPDHEWLRELEVVGRPIPPSAFVYFTLLQRSPFTGVHLFGTGDLLRQSLQICLKSMDEAERLEKLGKPREATIWLEPLRDFGLQLMRFEPRNGLMCLRGMAIASSACGGLKRAYQMLGDQEKLRQTEAIEKQLKKWIDEFRAAREEFFKLNDNVLMREIAQGKRDAQREERQILERTLGHTGLLDPPKAQAK